MSDQQTAEPGSEPVYVIESIPVGGDHAISEREIAAQGIPAPAHLRLGPEIGSGAMGHVHPALDRNLLRHVALKRLDQQHAEVGMYVEGFIAEAQMTGQLEHPNIVPVHELAIGANGVPYFTMKLVQGVALDEWLADPWRAPGSTERLEQGLEMFLKVCDAVAYAHHRGVIHRDLKPENIMVGDFGQVYLMDWGLAKLTKTRPASGTRAQMEAEGPVGTPTHMAPEQARGNPAEMDERSDVFGLGALLYELVSGRDPYGRPRTLKQALDRAKGGKVVPIDDVTAQIQVAKRLKQIVMKAVAPAPEDRYQTVVELQEEVRSFLRGGLHLPTETYQAGDLIVREGDTGDTAYMIVSGSCRAYRTVDGEQETLVTMKAGDAFGEMALLLDEPRAASVEAVDAVTVLVLDKKTVDEGLGVGGWTTAMVRAMAQRFRDLEQQVRESGIRRAR
ncbi:MAG: protein kinase [Deltaproteobacteria bacterium]|jgi:serine/threonine-protein kinase|nr:protein kinase [Deltaproteobacteria bacterium]MBW2533752.1 protein kinase [Deltaproteobacteria bacterium]